MVRPGLVFRFVVLAALVGCRQPGADQAPPPFPPPEPAVVDGSGAAAQPGAPVLPSDVPAGSGDAVVVAREVMAARPPIPPGCPNTPRAVILLIGDGMGPGQIEAGRAWATGGEPFGFERWPHGGTVTTASASHAVTDSAAAATAMSTGQKVANGVVAVESPGSGEPLRTIAEWYRDCGRATGAVTTAAVDHATPAAFFAHTPSRTRYAEIFAQMTGEGGPDVLLGGGGSAVDAGRAASAGMTASHDAGDWRASVEDAPGRVLAVFGDDHMPFVREAPGAAPRLVDLSLAALRRLDRDPDGFFLMIEGGRIDHAGHNNELENAVVEMGEFAATADAVASWAAGRDDVLVVLTADHETGGLHDVQGHGRGQWPSGAWSHDHHTNVDVIWRGFGPGLESVPPAIDNTDIFFILSATYGVTR